MADERAIYWDSCAFISRLERTADRIQALEELTDQAERGEVRIVTSILALAETAKLGQLDSLLPEEQEELIVSFFDNPYVTVRPLDYRSPATGARVSTRRRGCCPPGYSSVECRSRVPHLG